MIERNKVQMCSQKEKKRKKKDSTIDAGLLDT